MITLIGQKFFKAAGPALAFLLLFSALSPARAAAAGSLHITGTVTNRSGGGVGAVSVYATAPSGNTPLFGPTTTDSNGAYDLPVDPGTYDIHFDPSNGSGLSQIVQNSFSVTTDQTLNVQLTPVQHSISGYLGDDSGQPIPNAWVTFRSVNSGATARGGTDENGFYTLTADADVYTLQDISSFVFVAVDPLSIVDTSDPSTAPQYDSTHGDVTGANFIVPKANLTVTVKDQFGALVNAALVSVDTSQAHFPLIPGGDARYANRLARRENTNSQGVATLDVFKATYPAGAVCVDIDRSHVCSTSEVTDSGEFSITLQQPAQHTLTGSIKYSDGQGVGSAFVNFQSVNSGRSVSAQINNDGSYTFTTDADVYTFEGITSFISVATNPLSIHDAFDPSTAPQYDITNGNLTLPDFVLPDTQLTVTVKDSSGNLVPDVLVSLNGSSTYFAVVSGGPNRYANTRTQIDNTGPSGDVTLLAFKGSYDAGQICATIGGNQFCNPTSIAVNGPTGLTLQQPEQPVQHWISGYVKDSDGHGVPYVWVNFQSTSSGAVVPAPTDGDGHYSLLANADIYTLKGASSFVFVTDFPFNVTDGSDPSTAQQYDNTTHDVTLLDIVLKTSTLTVTVKDQSGIPIRDTNVSVGSGTAFPLFAGGDARFIDVTPRGGLTNNQGMTTIKVFATTYPASRICTSINSSQVCNSSDLTVNGPTSLLFQPAPVDQTPPTLGDPSWSANPVAAGSSTTLSISASDSGSGVIGGEYFLGADPGQGHGVAMLYSGGSLSSSLGASLAAGVYSIGIRAVDASGNWSAPTTTMLVVYDPTTTLRATGKNKKDLVPSLSNGDHLPGLISAGQTDAADYGLTVEYKNGVLDSHNDLLFTYATGTHCGKPNAQNCHTFVLNATSFSWLVIDGLNNSHARFQGVATVTIDGVTTTNPFTVEVTDGDRVSAVAPDTLLLKVYAPGADPLTASALYQASGSMPQGNNVRIQ